MIKKDAVDGSKATLFSVVINENAGVIAKSVVTKDVSDNVVAIGNPARRIE